MITLSWRTTDLDAPLVAATGAGVGAYRVARQHGGTYGLEQGCVSSLSGARAYWHPVSTFHATVEAAQADAADHAEHLAEVERLQRVSVPREQFTSRVDTPWGAADHCTIFGQHLRFYSTASHGGFRVDSFANDRMPDHLRRDDGWYEEDCEACKVVLAFPALFSRREAREAQRTYDAWCTPAARARHEAEMAEWQMRVRAENRRAGV